MKFCRICGDEISTKDGDNLCRSCEDSLDDKQALARRRAQRRAREQALLDCGLVKVRGAMGGTYWE